MNNRFRIVPFRIEVIFFLALAFVLGSFASAQNEVNLTYLTHWPPEQVAMLEEAIASYVELEPNVNINVHAVPFGNLLSTLRTQAASPSGPTITSIYELWLPELVRDEVAAPAPEPYAQDVRENWTEGTISSASVEETVYGYPNEVNLYALNYNKRLFEEAGLSGPPETWEELIDYAKRLTKRDESGNIIQQGFGLINSWPAGVVHPWLSLVYSNGGQLLASGEPQLTSDATMAVTELYHQLIFEDQVTDPAMGTANASTTGPYLQNFANGRTAMIIMANWWESALKSSMGEDFQNVATAPIPVGPNGSGSHAVSYAWLTTVNGQAGEAQQAAAWEFLQWLNSPESSENGSSAMGNILMSMGIMPSRTSDIEAHAERLNTPFLSAYVNELPDAIPFPTDNGGEQMTTIVQSWLEQVEFGQASPQEAMEAAQAEIESLLQE